MRRTLVLLVLLGSCTATSAGTVASPARPAPGTPGGHGSARVLFAGDVMLGRGVAAAGRDDPSGLLAGVRSVVAGADLAVANLESPLTRRRHDPAAGPN